MKYYYVNPSPKLFRYFLKHKLYNEPGAAREFFKIDGNCQDYCWREFFELDSILLLTIAVEDRRIVGWCIAFKSSHRALRDSLWCYVTPLQRRKGIGTLLVRKTTKRLDRTNFRTDDIGFREFFWDAALSREPYKNRFEAYDDVLT